MSSPYVSRLMRQYGITADDGPAEWAEKWAAWHREHQEPFPEGGIALTPIHLAGLLHSFSEARIAQLLAVGTLLQQEDDFRVCVSRQQAVAYMLGLAYQASLGANAAGQDAADWHHCLSEELSRDHDADRIEVPSTLIRCAVTGLELLMSQALAMGITAPAPAACDDPSSWAEIKEEPLGWAGLADADLARLDARYGCISSSVHGEARNESQSRDDAPGT